MNHNAKLCTELSIVASTRSTHWHGYRDRWVTSGLPVSSNGKNGLGECLGYVLLPREIILARVPSTIREPDTFGITRISHYGLTREHKYSPFGHTTIIDRNFTIKRHLCLNTETRARNKSQLIYTPWTRCLHTYVVSTKPNQTLVIVILLFQPKKE